MASRQTRSKSSAPKQPPTLRRRRTKNETEKPEQNASKLKKSHKGKRKCEFEDTVDGGFPSWRSSSDPLTEGAESTDGGPLNLYPMSKKGRLYIIRTNTQRNLNATSGVFPPSFPSNDVAGSSTNSGFLPRQADHLIAFATEVGHPAYRNRKTGSFYIEELTKTLCEEYSSKHLVDIITKVQGRVSNLVIGVRGVESLEAVQMPEFNSTLRGPIYLS